MSAEVVRLKTRVEDAWEAYVLTSKRAQQTHDLDDGIKAAHAYRDWLGLFLSDDQRRSLGMEDHRER